MDLRIRGPTRVAPTSGIDYITTSGRRAELHAGTTRDVIRESLQMLEEQADTQDFTGIHRSYAVRIDLIDALLRAECGDHHVQLWSGVAAQSSLIGGSS